VRGRDRERGREEGRERARFTYEEKSANGGRRTGVQCKQAAHTNTTHPHKHHTPSAIPMHVPITTLFPLRCNKHPIHLDAPHNTQDENCDEIHTLYTHITHTKTDGGAGHDPSHTRHANTTNNHPWTQTHKYTCGHAHARTQTTRHTSRSPSS
jgi:hypothetical protein